MKLLLTKPFYVFLLALFFCLHGSAENFGFISVNEVAEVFIAILIVITVAFAIVYFVSKSALYAGFIIFFIASVYLFFGAIKSSLSQIPYFNSYTLLLPFLFVFILLLILLVRKNKMFLSKFTLFFNLLFITYCLYDVFTIAKKQFLLPTHKYLNSVGFDTQKVLYKPNVYLLLFDEYAGYTSLADSFNFKNDLFYEQLKKDSFQLMPIHSNYSITQFSMASLFCMNYVKNIKDSATVGWQQTQQRMTEIKNAEVFDVFKSMNYEVKSFSLFEVGDSKSMGANQYLLGHKRVLTNKIMHNVLLKDIGWKLAVGKNAKNWMQKIFLEDMPVYNNKIEKALLATTIESTKPQFVYAHFLMPHFPFLYDSNGVQKPIAANFINEAWFNKAEYISYLKYCNKKIIEYEKAIIKKDPSAIVILMSDHGFRDLRISTMQSAFNNFCAIKTNQSKSTLNVNLSNVNFFRFLFNQNFNQQIKYCKDSIIFLKEMP